MSAVASASGGQWAYRGPNGLNGGQRATALGLVVALHALVIGGFVIAQLTAPKPPPQPTITVSLISEAPATQAPAPPQPAEPTPPPPERQMLATPRPTPSPMTAPPVEEIRRETPQQPAPQAPPQPAAPSSSAPVAAAATVTPPSFTAAYLNNPGPVYPASARRRRDEGVVRLRVQVSPDGAPLQVLLERTSGHPELDEAALDVVEKRWKFAPAKQGDRAVTAWVIVPLEFSIKR